MRAGAWISVVKGMCFASRALEEWCAQDLVQLLGKDGSGWLPWRDQCQLCWNLPWCYFSSLIISSSVTLHQAPPFSCQSPYFHVILPHLLLGKKVDELNSHLVNAAWEHSNNKRARKRHSAAQAAVLAPLSPWHRVIWRGSLSWNIDLAVECFLN